MYTENTYNPLFAMHCATSSSASNANATNIKIPDPMRHIPNAMHISGITKTTRMHKTIMPRERGSDKEEAQILTNSVPWRHV
jgi:hypothetical protein